MEEIMIIQGRRVMPDDLRCIRRLMEGNPSWHRKRLSIELCKFWNWRAANGKLKDIACRTFLLKLERLGHLTLPPRLRSANNSRRHRFTQPILHSTTAIVAALSTLVPIRITPVTNGEQDDLFKTLLSLYHYLGYSGPVGENMKYIAYDRNDTPLACLLFGAAAWKIAPTTAQSIGCFKSLWLCLKKCKRCAPSSRPSRKTPPLPISHHHRMASRKNALPSNAVPPAESLAERLIRPGVQTRKISYCTRSETGQLLRARLLSVSQTCRIQQRNALDFYRATIHAHRNNHKMPSLRQNL